MPFQKSLLRAAGLATDVRLRTLRRWSGDGKVARAACLWKRSLSAFPLLSRLAWFATLATLAEVRVVLRTLDVVVIRAPADLAPKL